MTRLFAVLLLVAGLGLVSAPATGADARSERAAHTYPDFVPTASDPVELRAAWEAWQGVDASAYTLRVLNSCFCLERPALETRVSNGAVIAVRYQGRDRLLRRKGYDMDRMFLILREAYAHAAVLDAHYSDRGVPTRISIDWDLMIADEEAHYSVKLRRLT